MISMFLILAAALSAGNTEFEDEARDTAATIAVRRLERNLVENGLDVGVLESAMLSDPVRFKSRAVAEELCRDLYAAAVLSRYTNAVARIRADLELGAEASSIPRSAVVTNVLVRHYAATFARERASACTAQAQRIALRVKPDEADLESKGDDEARSWLTSRIAEAKGFSVFEENLKYISEQIVDPILADARKERKRQQEYLMRTRAEAFAPSVLAKELESNLRKNVAERQSKCDDPQRAWNVFPRVVREDLPVAVTRRVLSLVAKDVEDIPVDVDIKEVRKVLASDPAMHRRAKDSERAFRDLYVRQLLSEAFRKTESRAPGPERDELAAFLKEHEQAVELARAAEARVRREVMPKWKTVRAEIAAEEAARLWPTLTDRTWYPEPQLADRTAARSDYAEAVKDWRREPELMILSAKSGVLEESDATADTSVAAAFDLARNAIVAQNAVVEKIHPLVLTAARDLSKGLFAKKPSLASVTEMLTTSVENAWSESRVETLWNRGPKPANVADQHVSLFPSVRHRIELEARQILEELEDREVSENSATSETSTSEDVPPEELCTISFELSGGEVTVRAKRGETVVAERQAKATAEGFEKAVHEVGAIIGRQVFRLK